MADAADEGDLVLLEAHPRAPAVAQPAAGQLALHLLDRDRQPGRQPLDRHHEGAAVRLAGGEEAEHRGKSTGGPAAAPGFQGFWVSRM